MSVQDGRQVAPTIDGIRRDHVERYKYALNRVAGKHVIDAACGIGYGSSMLAEFSERVYGYDIDPKAIRYAVENYSGSNIVYSIADVKKVRFPDVHVAVSFETIEHLHKPTQFLLALRRHADKLICSVPNQSVMPFDPQRHLYHIQHFTLEQIVDLLERCDWRIKSIQYQVSKNSPVADTPGQTIVLEAA